MRSRAFSHIRAPGVLVGALATLAVAGMSQVEAQQSLSNGTDDRWRAVSNSSERQVWLDTTSIERSGGVVRFWLKHRLLPARRGQIVDRWAIHCGSRTSWPLEAMAYDEHGGQTGVAAAPADPPKIAIAPESNLEMVMACVCGARR